jgi:hypothetical protein
MNRLIESLGCENDFSYLWEYVNKEGVGKQDK